MRLTIFIITMIFSCYASAHSGHDHFYVADKFMEFGMSMMMVGSIALTVAVFTYKNLLSQRG